MIIFAPYLRYVIGPKGSAINEMPSNDTDSETITLRGPQEKLGLALTKVYERANSVTNLTIDCPSWLHKYIIGKKGAGIDQLFQLSLHLCRCPHNLWRLFWRWLNSK